MVGIAGQSDEKLRVYRTTMNPFGAPDWDHKPFAQGNQPVAQQCYELPGKFVSHEPRAERRARWPTAPPRASASPRSPRAARPATPARCSLPGATSPDWGPADVPAAAAPVAPPTTPAAGPKLRLSRRGGLTATLTTGAPGRATLTASLKRRTIAKRTVTVGNGRATVRVQAQAARAGDRQGDVQAGRRLAAEREREAATALTISAPTTDPLRLSVRSPSVSV